MSVVLSWCLLRLMILATVLIYVPSAAADQGDRKAIIDTFVKACDIARGKGLGLLTDWDSIFEDSGLTRIMDPDHYGGDILAGYIIADPSNDYYVLICSVRLLSGRAPRLSRAERAAALLLLSGAKDSEVISYGMAIAKIYLNSEVIRTDAESRLFCRAILGIVSNQNISDIQAVVARKILADVAAMERATETHHHNSSTAAPPAPATGAGTPAQP